MTKAPQKVYELVIRVGASDLTTVMEVVKDSADIVGMRQVDTILPAIRSRPVRQDIKITDLIMQIMSPGVDYKSQDIGDEISTRKGFSPNSATPALSELVAKGKVLRVGSATYRLAPSI